MGSFRLPLIPKLTALFLVLVAAAAPAVAATRTWTGLGADTNWMTAGNWDVLPVAGDDLVFPAGVPAPSLTNNNNFPALTSFNSITLSGSGYALGGNSITLAAGGITSSPAFGNNTINFNIALGATATFTVTSSGELQVFGVISGSSGLTKAGADLLRLRGANTYLGTSTVNAGRLSIEATMTASSVTVNSGGIITGSNVGHMGPVTVLSGGTLDPGVDAGGAAIITIEGNLAMSAGSTFIVDLNGLGSPDRVAVTGTVNLGGSTLTVNDNFGSVTGNTFNIISNDAAGAIVGTFAGLTEGATFPVGGSTFSISYVGADGNDMVLTNVSGGVVTPTPSPTPTLTQTVSTSTPTPTATPTPTGTVATATPTPTSTPTPTGPVATATSTPTSTPTPTGTVATATSTPSPTPTPTGTVATATSTPTPTVTATVAGATATATTAPPVGAVVVPTLSFPLLLLLGVGLALAGMYLARRGA